MNKKAISLLSGGLDSILATKLVLEQGIEVQAVNFSAIFCSCLTQANVNVAERAATTLKVPLVTIDFTKEFIEVIKSPQHGWGSNVNPCIDCRIFMLKRAKAMLAEYGASFIVTGEVVGERPMSQRRAALSLIDKRADVRGLVLRPLSAKLLDPTAAEEAGLIDREKLLDIRGRSRRPQIALAEKFGIDDYPNPAGGCLLTDPGFARRVKDLLAHDSFDADGLALLTVGKHFRLSDKAKLVVGRDEDENKKLEGMKMPGDTVVMLAEHPGPFSIIRGVATETEKALAACLVAYNTKYKSEREIKARLSYNNGSFTISVNPANQECADKYRI